MRHRRRRKPSKSTRAIAKRGLRIAKKIASGIEMKHVDYSIVSNQLDWDGTLTILNDPSQGTKDTDRIGDTIHCSSFNMRFVVRRDNSACNFIRVIVFRDNQNDVMNINQLLTFTGAVDVITSPYIKDIQKTYKIHYDKVFKVSANANGVAQFRHVYRKLGYNTQFIGGTQNFSKNSLKVFFLSDISSNQTQKAAYQCCIRFNYTDA